LRGRCGRVGTRVCPAPVIADECFDALEGAQGAVAGEADVACVVASVMWEWAWLSARLGGPYDREASPGRPIAGPQGTDVHIYGTQEPGHRPIQCSIIRS
jgi:hypothetical protein